MLALCSATHVFADGGADDHSIFEVGGGGGVVGLGSDRAAAVAVFKVDLDPKNARAYHDDGMIPPSLYLEVALGWKDMNPTVPYIDAEVQFFRAQFSDVPKEGATSSAIFGWRGIGGTYGHSEALGLEHVVNLTLFGFWMNSKAQLSEDVQVYLRAAVDAVAGGFIQKMTTGGSKVDHMGDWGPVLRAEVGVKFGARVRLSAAELAKGFTGDGYSVQECATLVEGICVKEGDREEFRTTAGYSRTALTGEVTITRQLKAYVEGGYEAYWMGSKNDSNGAVASESDSAFSMFGGLKGRW